jgi:tetratricopeptide (TPR) repeat protein
VTSEPSSPLSKHVVVDVSPARVARVWAAVSTRLETAPRGGKRWLVRSLVAAAAAGVLALGVVGLQRYRGGAETASAWQGAALSTSGDAMAVKLDDGSEVELAAHTLVKVTENRPSNVALGLSHGRVDCDIVPRPGRQFVVFAGGVEVRVTGTRFSVELAPPHRVEVEVTRGSVEVSLPGAAASKRLAAGERWSIDLDHTAAKKAAPSTSESPEAPSAPTTVEPPSSTDAPRPSASQAREPAVAGARELFDLGNAARRAGDATGAVRAYEQLLEHHPRDARAGLAAFELGRLRMDRLGDVHGAIQALQRAVALAPGAGFREDAMARLVDAYSAAGATERCRSARSAYLESYPTGVRAAAVARRCGSR